MHLLVHPLNDASNREEQVDPRAKGILAEHSSRTERESGLREIREDPLTRLKRPSTL